LKRIVLLAVAVTGLSVFGLAAPAFANPNPSPSGTGPPSQTCQSFSGGQGITGPQYPGNTISSPGSVFNEPNLLTGAPGGQGGQSYNNARQGAGAPSQYDVACYQHFQHSLG
jgi:hypothetical protein